MKYFTVFKALTRKLIIEKIRYWPNSLTGIVIFYIIFVFLFFGAKKLIGGGPAFGQTLEGIIVGYLVWLFTLQAYSDFTNFVTREAKWGTLEHLYTSATSFSWVCTAKMVSSFLVGNIYMVGSILLLAMVTTGRYLHLDIASLVPLLILTLAGPYGFSFFMGGLALVYKRVSNSLQILNFLFIGLIAAPFDKYPFLRFLPLAQGTNMINEVMTKGVSITDFQLTELFFLIGNSSFYLGLGFIGFKFFEKLAQKRGLLGHY